MSRVLSDPIFTSVYSSVDELSPGAGSLYVTGESVEERSRHTALWEERCPDATFAYVCDTSRNEAAVSIKGRTHRVLLRSLSSMAAIVGSGEYSSIYLDITGLEHSVWAPLLRALRGEDDTCLLCLCGARGLQVTGGSDGCDDFRS